MDWNDVIRLTEKGNHQPDRKVEKSDAEWREILSPDVFRITRQKGTERPFTGAYCQAHEPGKYACICCDEPLFDSGEKYDSRSGWPSFTAPVKENAIRYEQDGSHGMQRIEVMCNVCGSHLGHVFPDGPRPTGLRFCINSASIKLIES